LHCSPDGGDVYSSKFDVGQFEQFVHQWYVSRPFAFRYFAITISF